MYDGVLANYGRTYRPDVVAQARFGTPNLLLHVGGALHEIHDVAAWDCCYSPDHTLSGAAATAGGEYRVKWSDVFGSAAGDTYGRFLLQGALARGAIGYLGIPFFATDYVVNGDGDLKETKGYSAVASYEHLWTPTVKSSITYSIFGVSEFVERGAARAERADVVRRQGARRVVTGRDRGHGAARTDDRRRGRLYLDDGDRQLRRRILRAAERRVPQFRRLRAQILLRA